MSGRFIRLPPDRFGQRRRLRVKERIVQEVQRLSRHGGRLPRGRAGVGIGTIEERQVRVTSLPLHHHKHAAPIRVVHGAERIVLRERPSRLLAGTDEPRPTERSSVPLADSRLSRISSAVSRRREKRASQRLSGSFSACTASDGTATLVGGRFHDQPMHRFDPITSWPETVPPASQAVPDALAVRRGNRNRWASPQGHVRNATARCDSP